MGLEQVIWYNSSISLTLDTVVEYVTTYRGSNITAVTKTSTTYGDIDKVNAKNVSAAMSIYLTHISPMGSQYAGGGNIYLARGTDGALGLNVSFAWPSAYWGLSTIAYITSVSRASSAGYACTTPLQNSCDCKSACPTGLQNIDGECGCAVHLDLPNQPSAYGVTTSYIPLPTYYYSPMSPEVMNYTFLEGGVGTFHGLDLGVLSSWLVE